MVIAWAQAEFTMRDSSGDVSMTVTVDLELHTMPGPMDMERRQVFVEKLTSALDTQASVASQRGLHETVPQADPADGAVPTTAVAFPLATLAMYVTS
jgi:hypothetical protein